MTKEEMIKRIRNMIFYEEEYDVLNKLLIYCDDVLFVKIMEEVLLGNLSFSDFEDLFASDEYQNLMSNNIRFQSVFNDYCLKYKEYLYDKNLISDWSLVLLMTTSKSIVDIDKKNKLFSILLRKNDNILVDLYKNILIEDVLQHPENIDNLLFSINNYRVPIDYDHIILDDSDIMFMNEQNISEEDMKKIKSLTLQSAVYLKQKGLA